MRPSTHQAAKPRKLFRAQSIIGEWVKWENKGGAGNQDLNYHSS
jgi:hypothetical protein